MKATIDTIRGRVIGLPFTMEEDDIDSPNYSDTINCYIAAVDPEIGYTIKDINDDDPDAYIFCYDLDAHGDGRSEESDNIILSELLLIEDLARVKGQFKWSDFVKASTAGWDENGGGPCPF